MNFQKKRFPKGAPPQFQSQQPGLEANMDPQPIYEHYDYKSQGERLQDKVALITGGDSGIGKAVALAFAKEGAKVAIVHYHTEFDDAKTVQRLIEEYDGECMLVESDLSKPKAAEQVIDKVLKKFKSINILVNNAAVQHPQKKIEQIDDKDLHETFNVNFFGSFYMTKACVSHMNEGDNIIFTTSVVASAGHKELLDYSASKGAITSFSHSLALQLAPRGIRVNCVAPGPIWTPLIPASFDAKTVAEHGSKTPLQRMGQPIECAPAYVMLASAEGSFMTGATIHVNGGQYFA